MTVQREAWLDALRGITIFLVIFHHCYLAIAALRAEIGLDFRLPLYSLDMFLSMVRMPAFFMCSGTLFAVSSRRGWRWFVRNRLAWTVWILAIWGWVAIVLIQMGVNLYPWHEAMQVRPVQYLLLEPIGNMWFIYAIAILGAFCMVARGLPPRGLLLVAVALSIVSLWIVQTFDLYFGLELIIRNLGLRGFLFFTIGFVFADRLMKIRDTRWRFVIAAAAVWIGSYLLRRQLQETPEYVRLVLAVPATFSALYILQHLIQLLPRLGSVFEFLGKRSLELFLLHQLFIAAMVGVVAHLMRHSFGVVPLAVMFAGALVMSIMAAAILGRLPQNFLFSRPRFRSAVKSGTIAR